MLELQKELYPASEHTAEKATIIGVGASAGGLEALIAMLSGVEASIRASFVVIQHLNPEHDSVMADILDRKTDLHVKEAEDGEEVLIGTVYLIPPGCGLRIKERRLYFAPFKEPRGARRPIDDFFISLAEEENTNIGGVILSGTGSDGSIGVVSIKEHGGITIVQNPGEAKHDGMPCAAISTGAVDKITSAEKITSSMMEILNSKNPQMPYGEFVDFNILSTICSILQDHTGHDFSGYKRPTLLRRIERRMQLLGIESIDGYQKFLFSNAGEIESLFKDLLINVTKFFRDPDNFDILAKRAIDPLVASAVPGEPIRIWVPACSTGEEAYSIAMICMASAERYGIPLHVQIFATDIDEEALSKARLGRYPLSSLRDIPEPYRSKYVDVTARDIIISHKIRDTIRFSVHSIIRDPSFSRIDLISCRNLFIYFNENTQYKVLPLIHFSLKPSGYLFLGPSESIGDQDKLFAGIDRQTRLYRKRDIPSSYPLDFISNKMQLRTVREDRAESGMARASHAMLDVSVRRILDNYSPTTVTINEYGEIVSSSGKLARYFEFSGHQGRELAISVARRGLREVLGPLLRSSQIERKPFSHPDVKVYSEFGSQTVRVIVDPLTDGHTLVVFDRQEDMAPIDALSEINITGGDERIHYLEDELEQVRLRLRATIEELETSNEELKSSNEEMMSMNEELQSTNEELTTANDDLKSKIDQLDTLNSDLRNFFESADLGVIILDKDIRIRAFTPRVRNILPLRESDKGRFLSEISSAILEDQYLHDCQNVLIEGKPIERLVSTKNNDASYLIRTIPYLNYNGLMDGITIAFVDVSDLKKSQDNLKNEQSRLSLALKMGQAAVIETNHDLNHLVIPQSSRELLGHIFPSTLSIEEFASGVDPSEEQKAISVMTSAFYSPNEPIDATFKLSEAMGGKWIRLLKSSTENKIIFCQDVTTQVQADQAQKILLREMDHRIKNIFSVISSILYITAEHYDCVDDFLEGSCKRIQALAKVTSSNYGNEGSKSILVVDLCRALLGAYENYEIQSEGLDVHVHPSSASSIGLILHEWATNSCKYGAMSHSKGMVYINIYDRYDHLVITWDEYFNEPLPGIRNATATEGFGTTLVSLAADQLKAKLDSTMDNRGFSASLSIPMKGDKIV